MNTLLYSPIGLVKIILTTDDNDIAVGAVELNELHHLVTINLWHIEIEKHNIKTVLLKRLYRFLATNGGI